MKADAAWIAGLRSGLVASGPSGRAALAYIEQHRMGVGFHSQQTGARWTVRGGIELHPRFAQLPPNQPYTLSLIVHEVKHVQQGLLTALSVYGELAAWQEQFSFLRVLQGRFHDDPTLNAVIVSLMELELGWQRGVLARGRELMLDYAGKGYRIYRLPLYPLHREIAYQITRRAPSARITES